MVEEDGIGGGERGGWREEGAVVEAGGGIEDWAVVRVWLVRRRRYGQLQDMVRIGDIGQRDVGFRVAETALLCAVEVVPRKMIEV